MGSVEHMGIPIGPIPTVAGLQQLPQADGSIIVLLTLTTPLGPQSYFLNSEAAIEIGQKMVELGQAATSNLILPGPLSNGSQ